MQQTMFGTPARDPRGRVVLVCGGRDYADQGRVFKKLDGAHRRVPISILVEGDGDGADTLAGDWALSRGVQLVRCPANWRGARGRGEGSHRNQFQYDLVRPGEVFAFRGGPGTAHMMRYARSQGCRVREVRGRPIGVVEFSGFYHAYSNFYECAVLFEDRVYPTGEHAYAAAKSTDRAFRKRVARALTPGVAKRLGRSVKLRPRWDDMRIDTMREILRAKFALPYMRKRLEFSGSLPLEEGNHWHDNFFGACRCPRCANETKQNHLGKLLMEIRG